MLYTLAGTLIIASNIVYNKVLQFCYTSKRKGEYEMTSTAIKRTSKTLGTKQQVGALMTQIPEVAAADIGFGQCKIVTDAWRDKFQSVTKPRSEVVVSGLEDSEGFIITDENNVFNVGAKGSFDLKSEKLATPTDRAKYLAMLGLYNEATGRSVIDLMVSGLPIDEFKIEEAKVEFKDRLKGEFRFGFGHRANFMHVKNSLVLPQGAGAYYDYILNPDGSTNAEHIDLAMENILVLDPGGKTFNGCILEGSSFSQDSFTVYQGIHQVQTELRKLILKEHRYNVPPYEIDDVLRNSVLTLGGIDKDVEELCTKAIEQVFPTVMDELSLYVPDFRRFSAILLCGGGANVYFEYIKEAAGIPVFIMEDPEFANANGYLKYGKLKIREGLI